MFFTLPQALWDLESKTPTLTADHSCLLGVFELTTHLMLAVSPWSFLSLFSHQHCHLCNSSQHAQVGEERRAGSTRPGEPMGSGAGGEGWRGPALLDWALLGKTRLFWPLRLALARLSCSVARKACFFPPSKWGSSCFPEASPA